ncbi:hypothetical protein NDU88_006816 [Pleurodeles waltl]|uniref:Uncharacterized protein n=1 Tax=Pleurodeles waltl TaxID=8319 RepID=A0AAV7LTP0_PLEWA|nr:hypothetical protein NDU88_006816 [Pleurodeles waltl]
MAIKCEAPPALVGAPTSPHLNPAAALQAPRSGLRSRERPSRAVEGEARLPAPPGRGAALHRSTCDGDRSRAPGVFVERSGCQRGDVNSGAGEAALVPLLWGPASRAATLSGGCTRLDTSCTPGGGRLTSLARLSVPLGRGPLYALGAGVRAEAAFPTGASVAALVPLLCDPALGAASWGYPGALHVKTDPCGPDQVTAWQKGGKGKKKAE